MAIDLEYYVDEGKDGKQIAVGGILASAAQWDTLYPEWETILSIEPTVPYWHQSEAASDSEFFGLSREQRKQRAALLTAVIRKIRPRIVTAHMKAKAYESLIHGKISLPAKARKVKRMIASPYHLLHVYLIRALECELKTMDSVGKVKIIMERSDDAQRDKDTVATLLDMKPWYFRPGTDPISEIIVKEGKTSEARALEAADMALWHVRRALGGDDRSSVSKELGSTSVGMLEIDEGTMSNFVELLNKRADELG